jgi:DNA polymerase/3'-5' exonuclease PolX
VLGIGLDEMTKRFELEYAEMVALAIKHHFDPFFERLEIAGSIRRRKPTVKDIELVGIPKMREVTLPQTSLFEDPTIERVSRAQEAIDAYNAIEGQSLEFPIQKTSGLTVDGDRMKKLMELPTEVPIDLFLTTQEQWGYIFVLRTGPTQWNYRLVKRCKQVGLRLEGGTVYRGRDSLPVFSEEQMFRLARVKWVEPQDRK